MTCFIVGEKTYLGSRLLEETHLGKPDFEMEKFKIFRQSTKATGHADALLYLSHPSRKIYAENPVDYFEICIREILKTVILAKNNGFKHLLYTGTYYQNPINTGYKSSSFYVASKESVKIILEHIADANFRISWLELFDVFGKSDYRNKILTKIVNDDFPADSFKVDNPFNFIRPIHYEDVKSGIVSVIKNRNLSDEYFKCYSLPGPEKYMVKDLINSYVKKNYKTLKNSNLKSSLKQETGMLAEPNYEIPPGWHPEIKLSEYLTLVQKQIN